jgi:hypothetical protein
MSDDTARPPSLARLLLRDAPADLAAATWTAFAGWRSVRRMLRQRGCGCVSRPNEFRPCARHGQASGGAR